MDDSEYTEKIILLSKPENEDAKVFDLNSFWEKNGVRSLKSPFWKTKGVYFLKEPHNQDLQEGLVNLSSKSSRLNMD